LNYQDAKGQWQESGTEIELVPGGAQFVRGQQQVTFSTDLNEMGAVQVRTAEGLILKTRVLGLAYYDLSSGQSVLIAQLQDSTGELLPNHQQIIYPNAFAEVAADVRYTVTRSSFEQDIVLREQLPDPAQYGLSPNSALQVLTEFFDAPAPAEAAQAASALPSTNRLAAGSVTPTVGDRLTFGSLSVVPGRAFLLDGTDPGVPVVRVWKQLEGRQFLTESVPLSSLRSVLDQLPPAPVKQAQRSVRDLKKYVQAQRLPDRRQTASVRKMRRDTVSAGMRPGLVLDYSTVTGNLTNLTFQGDTTYYVTGPVYLYGTTTIEGDTVVKFANTNNAQCQVSGTIGCQTGFYTSAIFTAKDDNSVGAAISGSTGNPSGRYAATALAIQGNITDLRNLRIGWATNAITYAANSGWPHYLTHVQVLSCNYGVTCQSPVFWVRNGLFNNVQTVFSTANSGVVGNGEHLTVDTANYFNGTTGLTLNVTNSLLVNVTNAGSYSGSGNATDTSAAFQTVGAGAHYLASGSPHHNAGTGNISYQLQTDFRNFTTYPPLVYSNLTITANAVWAPLAFRDINATPDQGYHYPALDYLVNNVTLNGPKVWLTNGVAVGVYGSVGTTLTQNGQFLSGGSPTAMNRLVRAIGVQEAPPTVGWTVGSSDSLLADTSANQSSLIQLRFTELDVPANSGNTISSGGRLGNLALQDCQLAAGALAFGTAGSYGRLVSLTNNVFARTQFYLGNGSDTTLTVYARNNLFWHCSTVNLNAATTNGWEWRDNLFDTTSIWQYYGGVTNSCNGYVNCATQILPTGTGNQVLSSLAYASGALGPWYLPASCPSLVDKGSRSATNAGLYHYTTQVSQAKETNSTVDIGFHYVAAVPAEVQLVPSSASSSSDWGSGWVAVAAIDGLTTNPGWQNASYGESPAYLRSSTPSCPNCVGCSQQAISRPSTETVAI
jgi:hypothetical protein